MSTVEVRTGSRIHITLIEMNGTETARVDGGIGVMLESPAIVVRARPAAADSIMLSESTAPSSREELSSGIAALVARVRASLEIGPLQIEVLSCPAAHTGLGAKTQVLLAATAAAIRSYDREVDLSDLAEFTGRGGTSGIGFHGFQLGGFIVDAGHPIATKGGELIYRPSSRSQSAGTPPLLARYEFPPWPVLIVTPPGHRIHGEWEARLFKEVCPIPTDDVRSVCQTILMRILPAIVENDLTAFGAGLWEIQSRRWKEFEIESQVPGVGKLMTRLRRELHVAGAGMSSWGTSIMCVDQRLSGTRCEDFLEEVRRIMVAETGEGHLILTRGLNAPATISVI
jgi:beta-ribofuranosylaminobenzene 5'-phosphate synthase